MMAAMCTPLPQRFCEPPSGASQPPCLHASLRALSLPLVSSSGAILNYDHAASERSLLAVDTVHVWGVSAGSVSQVSLSVRGSAPTVVPKSKWTLTSQGGLQVSGLQGASIKGGSGVAFALKWE